MLLLVRVIAYDHLGFGFSDKPQENYTYSLLDQAEQSLQLWRILGKHDLGTRQFFSLATTATGQRNRASVTRKNTKQLLRSQGLNEVATTNNDIM